jgi:hypothetical protein
MRIPLIGSKSLASSSPIITANWLAASSDRWRLPFGGGGGKIIKLGKQPMNLQLQAFCEW